MAASVAAGWPRSNGAAPSTANHRVAPSAHRSAAGPAGPPRACSGATYGSDPNTAVGPRPAAQPPAPAPVEPEAPAATVPALAVRVRWVSSWSEAMPEVGQLGPATGRDHHVGRLDVVVDDPRRVRRLQGVHQVQPDPGGHRRRQRARPLDQLAQGRRGHQLHDQEQPAVGLDHVVEGDDPRVVEAGGRPGLAQRPLPQRRPVGAGGPGRQLDLLDRHRSAEQDVVGPPHRAHPAPAQRPPEDIAARDQPAVGARSHDAGKYGRSPAGRLTRPMGKP
jgi:hypothetical protein